MVRTTINIPDAFSFDDPNPYRRFLKNAAVAVISISVFILAWYAVAFVADSSLLPGPEKTWTALWRLITQGDSMTGFSLQQYVSSSLVTFLKGFVIAFAVTLPLGLMLGYSRLLRVFTNPIIEMMRPVAPIVWAPFFIVMFGYQIGPMLVVFVGIFFPMLTNVMFGVMKVDPNWLDAAKTLGASEFQIFYKVVLPASIPYVMNGVKIGLGIGWMCIVAAEFYASPVGGMGFLLTEFADVGYWPGVFAAVIVVGGLGILTVGVADYAHRALSKKMGIIV
ncbi:MAG: ABC transporter permease [Candidatus Methanoplasma sp.]|jgi:NitT/TauT family transport system permease protein|nr:ABC transporter permease [Candidatus Methanoplasma sp.]